jgi:predicted flap endonuclease-1-like 5' DNA nuclease
MADLVLGPSGGNGGHEFDGYTIPAGGKVHEIRVNAGLYVDGLQLVYVGADGAVTELPHLGGRGGLHHTFTLDADEYLTGISGRSGRYIDSIRFHTNKRTSDKIGGAGGEDEFHFEAAANSEVAGFFGRADWFVDKLGVIVRDRARTSAAETPTKTAAPVAAEAATAQPATKPAAKSRKKTAPAADLVGIPDSAPVTPAAPDLVGIPDSAPVTPPAPDLIGIPQSAPVDATAPEYVGIPDSAPVAVESGSVVTGTRTQSVDLGQPIVDDLTKIEGIGPKVAQVLGDAGITTFAGLAATEVSRLRAILDAAGSRYRITDPTTWPEQAAHAARGDWDTFNALVARLKAGKRA